MDAPFGMDKLEKFEYSLPFCRCLINTFIPHIKKAEAEAGGKGFVTIESLSKIFTSPAWQDLNDEDSVLVKILLSDAFKDPSKGQSADQIDTTYICLYGLLFCHGTMHDKATHWYDILQQGGKEMHPSIAAMDKDLVPVFRKMC